MDMMTVIPACLRFDFFRWPSNNSLAYPLLAILLACILPFSAAYAALPMCSDLFPATVQSYQATGKINFGYNAQILNLSNSGLPVKTITQNSGSNLKSCGSATCVALGTYAQSVSLIYPEIGTTKALRVGYKGVGNLTNDADYSSVVVETEGKLTLAQSATPYKIKKLELGYASELTLPAGDFFIENMSLNSNVVIRLSGTGTTRLFVKADLTFPWQAMINMVSTTVAGDSGKLFIYGEGNITLATQARVAAIVVTKKQLGLGQSFLYGIANFANANLEADSRIFAQNSLATADLPSVCSIKLPDSDGDGISDAVDTCPNTAANDPVDVKGCPLLSSDRLGVVITEPKSLLTIGHSPVTVKGRINRPNAILVINGNRVPHSSGAFSAQVTVQEGYNTIIASATEGTSEQVTDSVAISLDLTPPYVTVDSHVDGQKDSTNAITVTGLVNDIVRGTIEATQAQVRVNGIVAEVSNRSYSAKNVPLVVGDNQIKITAADQVGNTETKTITVRYSQPVGKRIVLVSGQHQAAPINSTLAQPLVVKLLNAQGKAVVGGSVIFRVSQDSGEVAIGTANEGRAVVATTNAQGEASTTFKLGLHTGTENNKVRAVAVGYEGEVIFSASATTKIGNKLSINSGNNQRGVVGQVLPAPLVTVVTDEGANVVKGARVRYETITGGGSFEAKQASIEVVTDSDGRATARYFLGDLTGLDAQHVRATLIDAPQGQTIVAGFSASGFKTSDPGNTRVTGVVLDNQDKPIPGVTLHIEGTTRKAQSDAQGRFVITSAPVGPIHLIADGSTASVAGEFPNLSYQLVTIAGADNPLAAPIYMVKLNTKEAVYAGKEDVALTLEKYPGFKLEIAKNSVTFPDGSREGYVSVTAVNASAVPMAPPNGMQPQFIVTIQPTGTRFDAPARLTLPNVDGHAPGAQVEMYSYDHDLEEFVSIGLGSVSEDGSVIRSNPGVGVVKAGWHCGSSPTGSGTAAQCPTCYRCPNDGTACVYDPLQGNQEKDKQVEGDCKTALCSGATKDNTADAPKFDILYGDCHKPGCDGSTANLSKEIDNQDFKQDEVGDCKKPGCENGTPKNVVDTSDIKPEDEECKECDGNGDLKNKTDEPPVNTPPATSSIVFVPLIGNGDVLGKNGDSVTANSTYTATLSCRSICKNGEKVFRVEGSIVANWKIYVTEKLTDAGCPVVVQRQPADVARTTNHEKLHSDLKLGVLNSYISKLKGMEYSSSSECESNKTKFESDLTAEYEAMLIRSASHVPDFSGQVRWDSKCVNGVPVEYPTSSTY